MQTQEVLHLAAEYISSKIAYIADPYVMAIVAYALHKANHNSKDDAYYKLKRMNRTSKLPFTIVCMQVKSQSLLEAVFFN